MDDKRVFTVTKPEFTEEDLNYLHLVHDGKYLELYYNLIFSGDGFSLADHLRPIAWALGDKNINRLMVIISPGSGKSNLVDIAFPTWELGLDNNQTIIAVSAGEGLVRDFLQASMGVIESKIYKDIYPNSIPDKNKGWSKATGIFLQRSTSVASPSYIVAGVESRIITGKHGSILIGDDLHDENNTQTVELVDKLENWYYRTFLGRQNPEGARIILVGRRWLTSDVYGRLKDSENWLVMTLPVLQDTIDSDELFYDVTIPPNLSCVFNNFEPKDDLEEIRVVYGHHESRFYWPEMKGKYDETIEIKNSKPDIFETVYQSRPEATNIQIFNENDFCYYKPPENLHEARKSIEVIKFLTQFDYIIQSWDTAFTANKANDASVGYTLGLKPCQDYHRNWGGFGTAKKTTESNVFIPFHFDIYVLDEYYGRLEMGDLLNAATTYYNLWLPNVLVIENAVSGIPLIQTFQQYSIEVVGVNVQGTSKRQRALDGAKAGSAQGWFKQHRILFPQEAPWVPALANELKKFTGAKKATDDRVDALIHGINYAIDLGIEYRDLPEGWRSDKEIAQRVKDWNTPVNQLELLVATIETNKSQNPFFGCCGTCQYFINKPKDNVTNFCAFHNMKVSQLHSCSYFSPAEETPHAITLNLRPLNNK